MATYKKKRHLTDEELVSLYSALTKNKVCKTVGYAKMNNTGTKLDYTRVLKTFKKNSESYLSLSSKGLKERLD